VIFSAGRQRLAVDLYVIGIAGFFLQVTVERRRGRMGESL
jgi:hypothetical protein